MVEITWQISNMEHNVADGGVITAHWNVGARDGDYFVSAYGSISFTPNSSATDFVPYENLTEEIVIGWVKASLGEETVAAYESSLEARIVEDKNPSKLSGLPWNNLG